MTTPKQPVNWLERLHRGENEAFGYLYEKYYRPAAAFIHANSGQEQDARDIFQQALLVLFKKTRNADFRLTADPGAYLLAVVRNLWLYRLRTRQTHPEVSIDENHRIPDAGIDDTELLFRENTWSEKHHTVRQLLETLKIECQKLIQYAYYNRLSSTEIAALLGYSERFVKVKKHRCMEALREKVKNHPAFNHDT